MWFILAMTNQRGTRGNGDRDSRSEINNSATTAAEEQNWLIDAGKPCMSVYVCMFQQQNKK